MTSTPARTSLDDVSELPRLLPTEAIDERYGQPVTLLDGEVVRTMLSAESGTSRRRSAGMAGLRSAARSRPYAATRADVRARVTDAKAGFVLVHISTPLAECERRDRMGLYRKARAGLIPEFTGISDAYEAPVDADLVIDTTDVPVDEAVERVVALLLGRGALVPGRTAPDPGNE